MSKYREKVFKGLPTHSSDWMEHLKIEHKSAPSMTPQAYDKPKTKDQKNSYQVLAEAAYTKNPDAVRVLDLACGDGHLVNYIRRSFGEATQIVGIDMAEGELVVARSLLQRDQNLSFKNESADSLSEPSQSIDIVLCHMAFMLMDPVSPVIREIERVLKPGGVFAGIVGGGPAKGGFLLTYQRILREFMKSRFPDYKSPTMGDPRTRTGDGIKTLLCPPRFRAVEVDDFEVFVKVSPEGAGSFFEDMYSVSLLPPTDRKDLKDQLVSQAKRELQNE